jgi:ADP-heptose:LPS heptosyltransferase
VSSASFKKILVVNPFGIGDAIFSMYLVEALKKLLPQAEIGFLGNERTAPLLRMNRSIDVCHEFNRDEFRAFRRRHWGSFAAKILRFTGELKKEHYDVVFDLSLGREFSFVAALLGIPRRIGFDFKKRGRWLTHKTLLQGYEKQHVVDWQLGLLRHLGFEPVSVSARLPFFVSEKSKKETQDFLTPYGAREHPTFFAAAPGGGKSWGNNAAYKQWPVNRFAKVINDCPRSDGVILLIFGDEEERPILEQLKKEVLVPAVIVAGQNLEIVSALLERSRFLLCNDGGLLHLANALGVKSLSIYGPVDEKVYGPYGMDILHEVVVEPVPCRPCYQKFHFPPCEHERRCLQELSTSKVLAAVKKIC